MLILFWSLLGLGTCVLAFRYLYMAMMVRWWQEVCVLYVKRAGEHHTKIPGYIAVWPMYLMMGYVWEWDFARFIVDQESAAKILKYLESASQDSP